MSRDTSATAVSAPRSWSSYWTGSRAGATSTSTYTVRPDVLIERWNSERKALRRPEAHRQGTPAQQTTAAGATGEPPAMRRRVDPLGGPLRLGGECEWRQRAPDEDFQRDDIEFTANRLSVARGLVAFDWDLVSGHAALLIQRLPSGSDYGSARRRFEAELQPLVKIGQFEGVYISPAITALEKSGEVRHRQLEHATELGEKISFVSRAPNACAMSDPC